jgi:ER-bound oxygenase mpaB/B'/Rubber oxygenase, catalytic domain
MLLLAPPRGGRSTRVAFKHAGVHVTRPLVWFNKLPTVGLLPPAIRQAYGFPWNARHEQTLRLSAGCIRRLLALTPSVLVTGRAPGHRSTARGQTAVPRDVRALVHVVRKWGSARGQGLTSRQTRPARTPARTATRHAPDDHRGLGDRLTHRGLKRSHGVLDLGACPPLESLEALARLAARFFGPSR